MVAVDIESEEVCQELLVDMWDNFVGSYDYISIVYRRVQNRC